MPNLPEHQPYRLAAPNPLNRPISPAAVDLYADRPPVAWVPDPLDPTRSVPVDARLLHRPEPPMPRDLTPAPLIDPRAQLLVGGGVFAAGAGWGVGQALAPLAGLGTGTLVLVAAAVVAWRAAPPLGRGRTVINQTTTVHNSARWFGRTSTWTNQ